MLSWAAVKGENVGIVNVMDADWPLPRSMWECIACPPGVIHGFQNDSLEPVYMQVMLGRGQPEAMGYADDELYRRGEAHLAGR